MLLSEIEPAGGRRRRSSIRSWAKKFSLREVNAVDEGPLTEGGGQRHLGEVDSVMDMILCIKVLRSFPRVSLSRQ